MNSTFVTILNFTLFHDYYTNGFANGFVIMPTATTEHFLKKHRLIFKNTAHGFLISCDSLVLNTLPQILAERRLSFMLKLKNNDFMNFTVLPQRSGSKDIYYLDCLLQNDIQLPMNARAIPQYPPVFTYQFIAADNMTDFQVEDPEGNIRISETITNTIAGQQLSISVNLESYTSGLYRFIVQGQTEEVYITDEPPGNGAFGLLAFSLPDFTGLDPETHEVYQYQFHFRARVSEWEYHLLLGKDYNGYTFTLEDRTEMEAVIVYTEAEPPPDYLEGTTIVFTSPSLITYREAVRKGLELTITDTEGSPRTYDYLPNPSAGNPESKIYITI